MTDTPLARVWPLKRGVPGFTNQAEPVDELELGKSGKVAEKDLSKLVKTGKVQKCAGLSTSQLKEPDYSDPGAPEPKPEPKPELKPELKPKPQVALKKERPGRAKKEYVNREIKSEE